MNNYKECYVAFLDILGFKNLIDTETFEDVLKIFQNIVPEGDYKKELQKNTNTDGDTGSKYNEALNSISLYTMSDSIVIAGEHEKPMALEAVIDVCMYVQNQLFQLKKPIMLRGAIAIGKYYTDKSIAFGKGMVDAYNYQEYYSIYPRIILSKEIVQKLEDVTYQEEKLYEDGYVYIDCIKEYLDGKDEQSEECSKFQKEIRKYLDGYYDVRLRKKYQWIEKEYDRVVKKLTYGPIEFLEF